MRPRREPARNNQQTYFLTFVTAERTPFFRHERWLLLFLNVMEKHSSEYALHAYVIMPDHIHLLITPEGPLERTAQLIKGGFSFLAKRMFSWTDSIWQTGFSDHRIRDMHDYEHHLRYIDSNITALPEALRMQHGRHSKHSNLLLTPIPPRLKPLDVTNPDGGTEVPPFQSSTAPVCEQNSL